MIIQAGIPFYSLCQHHHLPFFGTGVIAYIPNDFQVGLSKLARTLEFFSRSLTNQERIATHVLEFLKEKLETDNVAVILKARHMCMEMRGIKKHDTHSITSALSGVFKDKPEARAELMSLI